MENATKALLIAAAVLIAIVIIAGGIALLNSGANSKEQADMVGQEIGTAIQGATGKIQTGLGSIGNKKCSYCEGTGVIEKLVCIKCDSENVKFLGSDSHDEECDHYMWHDNCPELIGSGKSSVHLSLKKYCNCEVKDIMFPMCYVSCSNCSYEGKIDAKKFDCPDCEGGHVSF